MNVFSIVRVRCPSAVEPCPAGSEIYSFTLSNAPSTRTPSALNRTPSPIFWPLRESWDPVLAIVFFPSFTTFSGVLAFGIEDNTEIFSLSFLAIASTSACVNSLLFNTFLAFSKSILIAAKVDAGTLSLLIFSSSSSTFSILVCNFVLSNACFSVALSTLVSLFTVGALVVDTSAFLLGTTTSFSVEILLFRTSVFPSVELVTFSTPVSFSIFSPGTSPALAIPAAPKKILAPITTDAAPTLNFLIE